MHLDLRSHRYDAPWISRCDGRDRAWRWPLRAERRRGAVPRADKALIAITLDLEMSRNFPTWDEMHWDYEKGNLDAATKRYAVEAARRVKARGGVIHFFALGQTMEQEDVGWLREIVAQGHPVGNHTYDHVNVKATRAGRHPVSLQAGALVDRGQDASQR